MKTQVEFRTSKFPPEEGEEENINPGVWGKRLAEYLVRKLSDNGVRVGNWGAEDWGYYIPIEMERVKFALCCGHQDGDDDQFLCFIDPNTPLFRKFFKKADTEAKLFRLSEMLNRILSSDPEIKELNWTER